MTERIDVRCDKLSTTLTVITITIEHDVEPTIADGELIDGAVQRCQRFIVLHKAAIDEIDSTSFDEQAKRVAQRSRTAARRATLDALSFATAVPPQMQETYITPIVLFCFNKNILNEDFGYLPNKRVV